MNLPSHHSSRPSHFLAPLAVAFAAVAAIGCMLTQASAQLLVEMKLNKNLYVAYEPIIAEITVSNRAGRDIVLGGPAGASWLNFDVASDHGEPILPSGATPVAGSTVLGAGKSHTLTVSLGKYYALGKPRNYRVKASVYFAGTGQYIGERPQLFGVTKARLIWQQVVGIPRGKPEAGNYRHYSLLIFRDTERTLLYVRVRDQKSKRVLATYSLGRLIEVRDPQATIDGENRLHVLFLGAPRTYSHKVINYGGETLLSDVYKDEPGSGSPQLMLSSSGKVQVAGGSVNDPTLAAEAAAHAASQEGGGTDRPRNLSDRPEGLPFVGE